ncbi:transposase [Moorena producens JHB]|uniref:Transposase n=1 Tax=Moorena producens (strain JHB) TaxID=1454205 RepID=A0A1D9G218_MOOP1|nr:transposase [Moorena producens]AOY81672.1 transposase [Moorena producens JHB]
MNEPIADYDNPWKEALQAYFESFLQFCFPEVHTLIDWNQTPQALDTELQQIVGAAESGKRIADKLFQVWLCGGNETWVLIHVEVQSQKESTFAKGMYQYHYRAFDLYEKPVISLAVLGDENASWSPSSYEYGLGGCRLSLEFPIVKLLNYESRWQVLESSTNPFAVVVMAHLKTKATHKQPMERKRWKWYLIRRLFEQGYSKNDIVKLFQCIDQMMALPEQLEQELNQELERYQEERQMPLISRVEERAMKRGLEQGLQQGLQQSRKSFQGTVVKILQKRFESVSPELVAAINAIDDISGLEQLIDHSLESNSLEEFEQLLAQHQVSQEN